MASANPIAITSLMQRCERYGNVIDRPPSMKRAMIIQATALMMPSTL